MRYYASDGLIFICCFIGFIVLLRDLEAVCVTSRVSYLSRLFMLPTSSLMTL